VNRLRVRVLLDTGPTEAEVERIRALFAEAGMDADAMGHSYGGPPLTSAFRVVVNVPLMPFLDTFVGLSSELRALLGELAALRADERDWGRPHTLYLEHAFGDLSVALPSGLPAEAVDALLEVDLTGLELGAPPVTVVWDGGLRRWQARPEVAGRDVRRRLPRRQPEPSPVRAVRHLSDGEVSRLWRLTEDPSAPAITWLRATVVLCSALGWTVAAIGRRVMLSERRVRAVIGNFDADGFAALDPGYAGGEPVRPTAEEQRDASAIAASRSWSGPEELGEHLVAHGLAEDADPSWLESLLHVPGVRPAGQVAAGHRSE
jgi:hypothetical protein